MEKLTWTAKRRKLSELKPLEKNPRKITKAAMDKLKDRITKRGFHDVLKLDTNDVILSGNQRTQALLTLGVTEVNVLVPSRELTEEERGAIVIESNRNDGEWDMEILPEFGQEVLLEGGFETVEVDAMLKEDEDEEDQFETETVLDAIKKPQVKPGELYRLGDHMLLCGDSTSKEDVSRLMGGVQADMIFTDPPYNMNIEGKQGKILNDNMSEELFLQFSLDFIARMKEASKAGAPFYICSGYSSYLPFTYAIKENNLVFANPIIWVKNSLGMGMNDYRHAHEMILKVKNSKKKSIPILYGWNQGKHYFKDVRDEGDVWNFSRRATNTMSHPTQKPVALVNRAITNSSKHGGVVLDLFGGSGTTLISAQKTGRKAYVMEMDPRFCDVIIKRFEALTGEKAEKVGNNK